jgi:hypothetical protein
VCPSAILSQTSSVHRSHPHRFGEADVGDGVGGDVGGDDGGFVG